MSETVVKQSQLEIVGVRMMLLGIHTCIANDDDQIFIYVLALETKDRSVFGYCNDWQICRHLLDFCGRFAWLSLHNSPKSYLNYYLESPTSILEI